MSLLIDSNDVWDLLTLRRRALRSARAASAACARACPPPSGAPSGVESDDVWNRLRQPVRLADAAGAPPSGVEPRYRLLLAALDMGWRIEEPVYLRPRWGDEGQRAYYFILRRADSGEQKLLSVPEGQEVKRFVHDQRLSVSMRQ